MHAQPGTRFCAEKKKRVQAEHENTLSKVVLSSRCLTTKSCCTAPGCLSMEDYGCNGDASLWPVSGQALAHGDDLWEGAPWPSLACLSGSEVQNLAAWAGAQVQEASDSGPPAWPHGQPPTSATRVKWRPQPTVLPCVRPWPVSGGLVAGEAQAAWPTIEQKQQSLAHPRKHLITVRDIKGLPLAMRAQWPDVCAPR